MERDTEEKVSTHESNAASSERTSDARKASGSQTIAYLIYFIFGILETILVFRFVLKLLGANPSSGFVDFIYNISAVFVTPFAGIFRTSLARGAETTSVFEPATLIAIVVYAIIAWGIVKLIKIFSREQ